MINKSKTLVLGLAALMTLGLVSCGGSTGGSTEPDIVDPGQNTSTIEETMYNLQIVGSMDFNGDGKNWDPNSGNPHFVRESKMLWKLLNVTITADAQFKFTFNDTWNNDFGFSSVDTKQADYPADTFEDAGGNIHYVGTADKAFDFYYHPFWQVETGVNALLVIKVHA